MKRVRHVVVALLLLSSGLSAAGGAVLEPTAFAAGQCNGTGNYFVGYDSAFWNGTQPEAVEGVSANIYNAGGDILCTGDNSGANFTTAWTMMATGDGTQAYVQSGTMYRFGYGSCVTEWAEQRQSQATNWFDYYRYVNGNQYVCSAVGSTDQYWQQLVNINGQWLYRSNVDGYILAQSSWSPVGNWAYPYRVEVYSEVTHPQSDVPGNNGNRTSYSGMQVQSYTTNNWGQMCGNQNLGANITDGNFAENVVDCNDIQTWTINQ